MLKRLKYALLLVSIAGRMLAFSSEDIDTGRVKEIDLPAGHSILVPSYFEVGTGASGDHDSLSVADPEGYLYCTVQLLPVEPQEFKRTVKSLLRVIREVMSDAVFGEPTFEDFALGAKRSVYIHLPVIAPVEMSFSHLVVQAEERILRITISIPEKYEGEDAGLGTRFARMILLSLKDSDGTGLKPVKPSNGGNPTSNRSNTTEAPAVEPEWLYSKAYFYREGSHVMTLEGLGRVFLDVVAFGVSLDDHKRLYPSALKVGDTLDWKPGKRVRIAYDTECGAVLLDPETGKFCEITGGLAEHPLDALREEYTSDGTQESYAVGTARAIGLWEKEIDRIYHRLRYEMPGRVEEINQAQASWESFYEVQLKALRNANDKGGTLYLVSEVEIHLKLVRDHARGLARWGRF